MDEIAAAIDRLTDAITADSTPLHDRIKALEADNARLRTALVESQQTLSEQQRRYDYLLETGQRYPGERGR